MRFSLVVMTYQRPEALRRCLDAIARLRPPAGGFEVVVVDDGSPGREAERVVGDYASSLAVAYHRIEHRGVSAARNAGFALSRGELVAFVADDYTLPGDYLLQAERFLAACPQAEVLTSAPAARASRATCSSSTSSSSCCRTRARSRTPTA